MEGGRGRVRGGATPGIGDQKTDESTPAAHVEQIQLLDAVLLQRLDLAGGDFGEGESAIVGTAMAEAAGERGEGHLVTAGHARLPVGREVAHFPEFALLDCTEKDGMLRFLHHVDRGPHELHRLQGCVGIALEGREEASALDETLGDVLKLVQHKLGRHGPRCRHEQGGIVGGDGLGIGDGRQNTRRTENSVDRQPCLDQMIVDRPGMVEVKGMGEHGCLGPEPHRLAHDDATAVPRDKDPP